MKCPNKSHPMWKSMVSEYGEIGAYQKWIESDYKFVKVSKTNEATQKENLEGSTDEKIMSYFTDKYYGISLSDSYTELYKLPELIVKSKKDIIEDLDYAFERLKDEDDYVQSRAITAMIASYKLPEGYQILVENENYYLVDNESKEVVGRMSTKFDNVIISTKLADKLVGTGIGQKFYTAVSKGLQAGFKRKLESWKEFNEVSVEGVTKKWAEEAWNRWVKKGLALDKGNKFVMLQKGDGNKPAYKLTDIKITDEGPVKYEDYTEHTIELRADEGLIQLTLFKDDDPYFSVYGVNMFQEKYEGKGLGTQLYIEAAKYVKTKYNMNLSTTGSVVEGNHIWDKLLRDKAATTLEDGTILIVNPYVYDSKNNRAVDNSLIERFAKRLEERFNIPSEMINSDINARGYYNDSEKKAYLIKGKAGIDTTIHEAFTHPFLIAIQNKNRALYDNLLREAKSDEEVVKYVQDKYGDVNEHEFITRAMDLIVEDKTRNKSLIQLVQEFFRELTSFIKDMLGKNEMSVEEFNPNMTLEELADFVLYSNTKVDLSQSEVSTEEIQYQLDSEAPTPINNRTTVLSKLDSNTRYTKLKEGPYKGQYLDTLTGLVVTTKTASTITQKEGEINDYDGDEIYSEIGTQLGAALQDMLMNIHSKTPLSNSYDLSSEVYEVLVKKAYRTYKEIADRQAQINKINNTNETFELRTEQILVSERTKIGGSMDIFALFSDNTALVYDVKTIFDSHSVNNKGQLTNLRYAYRKKEKAKAQINEYVKQLIAEIGVKDVTMRRVVPLPVIFNKEDRTYTVYDTESNIKLGDEKTGITSLDEWLKKRENIIKVYEANLKSLYIKNKATPNNASILSEIELLKAKINKVNKEIDNTYMKQSFSDTMTSATLIQSQVMRELEKDLSNIDMSKVMEMIAEVESLLAIQEVLYDNYLIKNDSEEEKKDKYTYSTGLLELQKLLSRLKGTRDVIMVGYFGADNLIQTNREERLVLGSLNLKSDNFLMSFLGNASDQSNAAVQLLFKKISKVDANVAFDYKEYGDLLHKYSSIEGLDNLVDKKTGLLISKIDDSTRKEILELLKTDEVAALKKIDKLYVLPNYNEQEIMKTAVEVAAKLFNKEKDRTHYLHTVRNNNLLVKDDGSVNTKAIIKNFKSYRMILKDETKHYTSEYKSLTKEQKEAYDWFLEQNKNFREMLDIKDYQELPDNFIPVLQRDLIDRMREDGIVGLFNGLGKGVFDSYTSNSLDVEYVSNKSKSIPIHYLRTKENLEFTEGNRSTDLFSAFTSFGQFAFHYKHYNEVASHVEAFKDFLVERARVKGAQVTEESDMMRQINDYIDYYVYRETKKKNDTLKEVEQRTGVNAEKLLDNLSTMDTVVTLGGNWMSSFSSHVAGRTSVWLEAVKSNIFTRDGVAKATKDMVSNRDNYLAFCGFFEAYPDGGSHRLGLKHHETHWFQGNHPDKVKAYVGSRNNLLFKSWQWGEEDVTNNITVAMGLNYGIDSNGKVRKLSYLPEGSKPLYELMKYDKESGVMKFEGYDGDLESLYSDFRNIIRVGIRNTVGTANNQDIARYKMYLAGRLVMKYASWMPGVLLERLRGLRVNEYTQTMEMGRYNSVYGDYYNKEKIMANKMELVYATLHLVKDVLANLAFLGGTVGQNFYNLDRDKARVQFLSWKASMRQTNPYEIQKLEELSTDEEKQLDLYIQAKQGQMMTAMAEIRILVGLIAMTFMLGKAAGDDDDDNFAQRLLLKKFIRLTDKIRTEIGFVFSAEDWNRKLERPIPLVSLFARLYHTLANTLDEFRDMSIGENQMSSTGKDLDKEGVGFWLKKWLPGIKILETIDWMWEEDK